MQLLWSRMGPARQCGCRACHHALQGVGRHATTAARRRKPNFAEVFTACYSSMFASAAIIDAVRKEDRKQDLERQIQETRRELETLQGLTYAHEQATSKKGPRPTTTRTSEERDTSTISTTDLADSQMLMIYDGIRRVNRERPYMKEIKGPAIIPADSYVRKLQGELYNLPSEAALRESLGMDYNALERGLRLEEMDRSIPRHYLRTDLQLDNMRRRTLGLVDAMLRQADRSETQIGPAVPAPTNADLEKVLHRGDFPRFKFPQLDATSAEEMRTLHQNLRSIISSSVLGFREKVARVCYNLVVCPYPPNIDTINTMIGAFDKAGLYNISEEIAFSFQNRQKMLTSPLTYVVILNHYQQAGLVGQFLGCMGSLAGANLVKGAKHVHRVPVSWVQRNLDTMFEWAQDRKKRTRQGEYIYEHVPMSLGLIEALMRGLIHFKMYDGALSMLASCMAAGVQLGARVVRGLLDAIVLDMNFRSGLRVLREAMEDAKLWKDYIHRLDADSKRHLAARIHALLDMCGVFSQGQYLSSRGLENLGLSEDGMRRLMGRLEAIGHPVSSTTADPSSGDAEGAQTRRSKSRLLQAESMWNDYLFIKNTTMSLERKIMRVVLPTAPLSSLANHMGEQAVANSAKLMDEFDTLANKSGLPPLAGGPSSEKMREATAMNDAQASERNAGIWVSGLLKQHVLFHQVRAEAQDQAPMHSEVRNQELGWINDWNANRRITFDERVRPRSPLKQTFYWENPRRFAPQNLSDVVGGWPKYGHEYPTETLDDVRKLELLQAVELQRLERLSSETTLRPEPALEEREQTYDEPWPAAAARPHQELAFSSGPWRTKQETMEMEDGYANFGVGVI